MNRAIREGCRNPHGDCWTSWAVYAPSVTDEEIADDGWDVEGCNNGPGLMFLRPISIRRTKTRTLVTQCGGLDI